MSELRGEYGGDDVETTARYDEQEAAREVKRLTRAYAKDSDACPFCGGTVTGDSVTIEISTAYQEVTCDNCHAEWTDAYELDRMAFNFRPNGKPFGDDEFHELHRGKEPLPVMADDWQDDGDRAVNERQDASAR